MNIVKKLSLIYIALVILYYLPLINTFTQILMKLTPFALYIYWTILTLICIVVGAKYLDKMLGE